MTPKKSMIHTSSRLELRAYTPMTQNASTQGKMMVISMLQILVKAR